MLRIRSYIQPALGVGDSFGAMESDTGGSWYSECSGLQE